MISDWKRKRLIIESDEPLTAVVRVMFMLMVIQKVTELTFHLTTGALLIAILIIITEAEIRVLYPKILDGS